MKIVTNKGTLPVENRIQQEDAMFITAPKPGFTPVKLSNSQIAGALNIAPQYRLMGIASVPMKLLPAVGIKRLVWEILSLTLDTFKPVFLDFSYQSTAINA